MNVRAGSPVALDDVTHRAGAYALRLIPRDTLTCIKAVLTKEIDGSRCPPSPESLSTFKWNDCPPGIPRIAIVGLGRGCRGGLALCTQRSLILLDLCKCNYA